MTTRGGSTTYVRGGAVVADEALLAEGKHRRPPAAVRSEQLVADGVDAAVERMQPPGDEAPLDLAGRETAPREISPPS